MELKNNGLLKTRLIDYVFLVAGSFLLALGVVSFLVPNQVATGGTAGLAIVLHHLVNWPTGVLMILINIPLLALGLKYQGKIFALRTIMAIFLIVAFVDILAELVELKAFSKDLLLSTLYGGVLVGVGLGLIFKGGGSAGGGTILAKILSSKFEIKTGIVVMMLDAIVVCAAGWVFASMELALWSLISIFTTSKMIDLVLTGKQNSKIIHISSALSLEALSKNISEVIGVTGTIVNGNDLGATERKDIIFIVVEKNRINVLKNLVYQYDPKAKMIVMEATEMLTGD